MEATSLEKIKDQLVKGDILRIANAVGVNKLTVRQHLTGKVKRVNYFILEEAMKLINERSNKEKALKKQLETIDQ
jgi:hypothetical protein